MNNLFKKFFVLMIVSVLIISVFTACGNQKKEAKVNPSVKRSPVWETGKYLESKGAVGTVAIDSNLIKEINKAVTETATNDDPDVKKVINLLNNIDSAYAIATTSTQEIMKSQGKINTGESLNFIILLKTKNKMSVKELFKLITEEDEPSHDITFKNDNLAEITADNGAIITVGKWKDYIFFSSIGDLNNIQSPDNNVTKIKDWKTITSYNFGATDGKNMSYGNIIFNSDKRHIEIISYSKGPQFEKLSQHPFTQYLAGNNDDITIVLSGSLMAKVYEEMKNSPNYTDASESLEYIIPLFNYFEKDRESVISGGIKIGDNDIDYGYISVENSSDPSFFSQFLQSLQLPIPEDQPIQFQGNLFIYQKTDESTYKLIIGPKDKVDKLLTMKNLGKKTVLYFSMNNSKILKELTSSNENILKDLTIWVTVDKSMLKTNITLDY